jgi:hypothetical protein
VVSSTLLGEIKLSEQKIFGQIKEQSCPGFLAAQLSTRRSTVSQNRALLSQEQYFGKSPLDAPTRLVYAVNVTEP